ncbi:hypothetical protein ACH5BF_06260 [Arcobacter sp. YIC-464]
MKIEYYDSCYSSKLSSVEILSQFKLQGLFLSATILISTFFATIS